MTHRKQSKNDDIPDYALNLEHPEDFLSPESYLTPDQRLDAVTEIVSAIALRIITKRHESSSQNSNLA